MKSVRALYETYNIYPIFNIPASPEMNPIETCFAQVKRIYKKKRLNALVNKRPFDMDITIDDAFDVITP
jgi:transposase